MFFLAMLNRSTYFVRERVGILKLSDTYDIFDPDSRAQIGIAKDKPGDLIHALRLFLGKEALPIKVFVYEGDNPDDESKLLFSIQRGFTLWRSKVDVLDKDGRTIGWFVSKILSIGGAFTVFDAEGVQIAMIQGDWKGWNFSFKDASGSEIGNVTKKWSGVGKELFTTADNYMISLNQEYPPATNLLLLAAGLAVDTVFKEKK